MAQDLEKLDAAVPARRELLQLVSSREELTNGDVDPSAASMEVFNRRLSRIRGDFVKQQSQLQALLVQLEKFACGKANRRQSRAKPTAAAPKRTSIRGERR